MTADEQVVIDGPNEQYVIYGPPRIVRGSAGRPVREAVSFDEVMQRIEYYGVELAGRGALPAEFIDTPVAVARGTLAAYEAMLVLADELVDAARKDGEEPVAGLSPLLCGLEGHAVEVETVERTMRRFIVEKTDEPIPRHFEVSGSERRQADYDYLQVLDLGRVID
jgi:hypothetical protein